MLVFTQAMARLILADLIAEDARLDQPTVHLYSNNQDPGPEDVIGDYTEATFTGYAAVTVTAWSTPMTNAAGKAEVVGNTCAFVASGTPTAETVYGYFVKTAAGALAYAEKFDEPVTINAAADGAVVVPRLTLASQAA